MDNSSPSKSPWEYEDFELEIRDDRGEYCVCVLRSDGGEPQEKMRFPFGDKRNLKKKLEELEEALYYSSETRSYSTTPGRSRSPDEQTVQDFGRDLFELLLAGEVRVSYRISWREAKNQNKGLRLKLRVQPPELAQVPWEFLYDPSLDQYLCLSAKRPLVRYLNLPQPVEPLLVKPPLRVLGMVANPSDPMLDELDVEREKWLLGEATKELQAKGLVELQWAHGETFDDLLEEILSGPWHVFHFIGHGGFIPSREEGAIVLSDEEGQKRLLGAKNLANLLTNQFPLRLVFLNSCEGAKSGEGDAFSSAATTLVRQGVPAVVAMQYEITDKAATEFARSFYRAIAGGLPVDAAVAVGRTSLSNKVSDTLEWGTPVLYMRSPDGRVFDVSTKEDSRHQYREAVELAWANGELTRSEANWLSQLADRLELSSSTAAEIEREVMGETKEEIVGRPHRTVKVPDLIGQGWSEANNMLTSAGLKLGKQEEVPSDTAPEGQIVGQSPEAETEAEPDSLVSVKISKGPSTIEVPDLARQSDSEARSTLAAAGLKLGSKNEASSDTAPEGEIIGQYPVARTRVERGSSVGITVSSGPQKVVVPDLSGQRLSQARKNLAKVGLKLGGKRETRSGTVSKGVIIKQNPAAGIRVRKGNIVTVTASAGPSTVEVPDLTGQSLSEASNTLAAVGLKLGSKNEASSDTAPEGEIIGQYPAVRTSVEPGSVVSITVSTGSSLVKVPDLIGKNLSQARSELANAGLKLGSKSNAPSETAPEDEIIGQFPVARTKVKQGSSVRITVSSGAQKGPRQLPQKEVTVPNLIGKNLSQARSELANAGLKLGGKSKAQSETAPVDEIIGQFPMAQTRVKQGSSVRVTMGSGAQKRPRQRPQKEVVTVPNLIGKNLSQARSELASAGLKLGGKSRAQSETAPADEIIEQYPAAQTKVKRGSSVRVTVSRGPEEAANPGVPGRSKIVRILVACVAVLVALVILRLLIGS